MFVAVLSSFGFSNLSYGQGAGTAGGVDVEGSWYLGEGLKAGDYFEYSLCEIDLNDCAPIKLKMWIKGTIPYESETLWDAKVAIFDGNKIIIGSMGLGATSPEPITFDDDLFHYAIAFKSSLAWLGAFATGNEGDRIHGPQEFKSPAWGKIGAIGGAQLIPDRVETISIPAGTVDTVVVGWKSGNWNYIWIVDDFPFPVKALTYTWITTGIPPVMHQYTLLDYKENVTVDPFKDLVETIPQEELLSCDTEFSNHVGKHVNTNTNTILIQYNYAPEFPMEGCPIDWRINFMNPYNDVEFIDQVHYDIWVVDEDGNRLRSYAEDLGRNDLFNGFGQVHLVLPGKENAGLVRYAIFVHGTGPEYQVPDAKLGGYSIVEIQIDDNPLYENTIATPSPTEIPSWIKFTIGVWVDGDSSDAEFINAIKFLIEDKIIVIPQTTQGSDGNSSEIPSWIKFTTGVWVDGNSSDAEFISAIQFLITEGIMRVSS
ncbi:MAG: peptidase [Nitrosopumilus sp.]|nr:peptidase [Nitrosopumilus sp.]